MKRKKIANIQITDRNDFLLDYISPKYCWVVAREMRGDIATLNSCYSDDVAFSGYKWVNLNGSTVYDRRFQSVRRAVKELLTDQVGVNWKVYLIFQSREFIEFVSTWIIKKDNVLGDLGMLPPKWKDEIPKKDPENS